MSSSSGSNDAPAPTSDSKTQDNTVSTNSSSILDRGKEEAEMEVLKRELVVFGKDLGGIPCFRNSFLYGISGGIGSGIVHFALSSRVPSATKFGFYSYVAITFSYWVVCRYNYSCTRFRYNQLQYAMKQSAHLEGTSKAMPVNN